MKKKEVRWISRDKGICDRTEIWFIKPKIFDGEYYNPKTHNSVGRICRICSLEANTGVSLKKGGLAKVTIERQY